MTRQEIMVTTVGEMTDMISCLAVFNGAAEEKPKKKTLEIFDAISLR